MINTTMINKYPILKNVVPALFLLGAAAMPLSAAVDDEAKIVSDTADTKVVEICGRGLTEKSAVKDAARNAVVFVVGQLVDAQTITQNEDSIEDNIVSVSNGFVDNVQPIEGPITQNGTVLVRVRATVKSGQMKTDIAKFSEQKMDFNPSVAKAALAAKVENVQDMGKFLVNTWDTYIKLFKLEQVGDPKPAVDDKPELKFKLKFSLSSRDFRNIFLKTLRKSFKTMRIAPSKDWSYNCLKLDIPGAQNEEYYSLQSFFPDDDDGKKLWGKYVYDVLKNTQYCYVIECLGEDGEIIASKEKSLIDYDNLRIPGLWSTKNYSSNTSLSFSPSYDDNNEFFTSSEFDETVTFQTKEDIEDVKQIKVYVKKVLPEEKK